MVIESIETGRKEDGNRSIADKIKNRLHDLGKTVENNLGRWAWELLQNAKDSVAEDEDSYISVKITLDPSQVTFSHDGIPFTERDIRGLINQISSKEAEDGVPSRKVGKFGTGFLTTHLLSKIIDIKGVVKTKTGEYYSFSFPLDRSATTVTGLAENIETTWQKFHQSAKKLGASFTNGDYNTSFTYPLRTDAQKKIARQGIDEFLTLVPLALSFNPRIAQIEVIDNTLRATTVFQALEDAPGDTIKWVYKIVGKKKVEISILFASDDKVAIAAVLEKTDEGYAVEDMSSMPKLFCDFPLIGTENFHFPVIVNSFFFNPMTERDGIWLKGNTDAEVIENQQLLVRALKLYQRLVTGLDTASFFNLYNLSNTKIPETVDKYFDNQWFKSNIQTPIRNFLWNIPLIKAEEETRQNLTPAVVWLPLKSYSPAVRKKIWEFTYDLNPQVSCKEAHLDHWLDVSWEQWNKQSYLVLLQNIAKCENLSTLSSKLPKVVKSPVGWLNDVGKFALEDENNTGIFDKVACIPNRPGDFHLRQALFINEIDDEDLITILALLGDDWDDILLHPNIRFNRFQVKKKDTIAAAITEKIKHPTNKDDKYNQAITLLSQWFESNEVLGKDLLSEIYRRRAEIFMDTIQDKDSLYTVMRSNLGLSKVAAVTKAIEDNPSLLDNFGQIEEVNDLLKQFNIENAHQLKDALKAAQFQAPIEKTEITQETLIRLGVKSIKELEEALKDKNIAAQFTHTSTPRVELFNYVQTLITRSKKNILAHLKKDSRYDCDDAEILADTVISGIRKNGQEIYVVVRPSDQGEVIIYYSSERDTLTLPEAELWIDDGIKKPKQLTLGTILQTTGINRIPV